MIFLKKIIFIRLVLRQRTMTISVGMILFAIIATTMASSPSSWYNEVNTTQCIPGKEAECPKHNCGRAACSANGCILDCYLPEVEMDCFGCDDDEKEEHQLCDIERNNCKNGLNCMKQDDGCDNVVGRCINLCK